MEKLRLPSILFRHWKLQHNLILFFFSFFNRSTRFATFPDFLWMQMRKFSFANDWTPVKLDVALQVPQTLDLSWMKSTGKQSDEILMTEQAPSINQFTVL